MVQSVELVVECGEDEEEAALIAAAKEPTPFQRMISPILALLSPKRVLPPLPERPNPTVNGMLHACGCPWCGERVYMAERLLCFGREWHKNCFKCMDCSKTLTLGMQLDHAKKPYCKV
jgi:DNA-directed RNA polymerase subunit RPC12/RpoP